MEQRVSEAGQPGYVPSGATPQLTRLRRLEGQVRGVHRMMEEGRPYFEVITQLHAIAAAADKVAEQVLEVHIRELVTDAVREQRGDEAIGELMHALERSRRR